MQLAKEWSNRGRFAAMGAPTQLPPALVRLESRQTYDQRGGLSEAERSLGCHRETFVALLPTLR